MRIITIYLCLVFSFLNVYAQEKIIITTDKNNGWSITKLTQNIMSERPLVPAPIWITSKETGLLNNQWTYDVAYSNFDGSQNNVINNIGNGARALWITENNCDYIDDIREWNTYFFRKTFELAECGEIEKALFRYSADNSCRIYLNGKQIISNSGLFDYSGDPFSCTSVCGKAENINFDLDPLYDLNNVSFANVEIADVSDLLEPGVNVIAIEVTNGPGCGFNPSWICANLEIEFNKVQLNSEVIDVQPETCRREGSFQVIGTGSSGQYNYTLNTGASNNIGYFENLMEGVYYVTITNEHGCSKVEEVIIGSEISAPPVVIIESDLNSDCSSSETFIHLNSDNVLFSLDNGPYSNNNYFSDLSIGTHTIIAQDTSGCLSEPFVFDVYKNLDYSLNINKEIICHNDSILFRNNLIFNTGIYSDTVTVSEGCDSIYLLDLKVLNYIGSSTEFDICIGDTVNYEGKEFLSPGLYTYKFISQSGCDSIQEIFIRLNDDEICQRNGCDYFIPNVFSPNSDGKNDFFEVEKKNVVITYMAIYNRWGGTIYSSNDLNPKWDGNYNNIEMQPGVYVYLIRGYCADVSDKPFLEFGDVTLVR